MAANPSAFEESWQHLRVSGEVIEEIETEFLTPKIASGALVEILKILGAGDYVD